MSTFFSSEFKLVKSDAKLGDLWEDLVSRKTDMILVTDDMNAVRGVITVWDCLKALRSNANVETLRVEDIMSFPPITVRENVSPDDILEKLQIHRVKNVVVVGEKNKPIGIINVADAIKRFKITSKVSFGKYCRLENLKVAIIGGSGRQGFGLALRLAKSGCKVLVGSRSLEKALKTANEVARMVPHSSVDGGLLDEVVQNADIVFLTIPYEALDEAISKISDNLRDDHILITPIVPVKVSGREIMPLFEGISVAERIALMTKITGAKTIAAFHTIPADVLYELDNPLGFDVLICGNDSEAKKRVNGLVSCIPNLRPIDAGPLKNAFILEIFTGLLIFLGKTTGKKDLSIKLV
ncbi:MAG: NADPH-dependent F420 reductase [Candidatus Bathyarchaeota archaeon]